MRVVCTNKKNITICSKLIEAKTVLSRLQGLMFKKMIDEGAGLLLSPCNSIHTFFMRFNIDVIFLSEKNQIIKIIRNMKPWRMTRMYFSARKVLEVNGGSLNVEITEGDYLEVLNV